MENPMLSLRRVRDMTFKDLIKFMFLMLFISVLTVVTQYATENAIISDFGNRIMQLLRKNNTVVEDVAMQLIQTLYKNNTGSPFVSLFLYGFAL